MLGAKIGQQQRLLPAARRLPSLKTLIAQAFYRDQNNLQDTIFAKGPRGIARFASGSAWVTHWTAIQPGVIGDRCRAIWGIK